VQDVGRLPESPQERERRAAEEGEAVVVVAEAVHLPAREVLRRVDEKGRRARGVRKVDRDAATPAEPVHFEVVKDLFAEQPAVGRVVERVDERGVHALADQRLRERAGHVAKAAGFGERNRLGRKERDAHLPP
jgi:hypothetical protein